MTPKAAPCHGLNGRQQIGSHYHFLEVNPQLVFDRVLAFGHRLDIPSGTSTRFVHPTLERIMSLTLK